MPANVMPGDSILSCLRAPREQQGCEYEDFTGPSDHTCMHKERRERAREREREGARAAGEQRRRGTENARIYVYTVHMAVHACDSG